MIQTSADTIELAQPITWEALATHKHHFIGGECSWESKEFRTLRGPISHMTLDPACLEIEMVWLARFQNDPGVELWEYVEPKFKLPFIAPRTAKLGILNDGRVTIELDGDKMTLYPKGRPDALKPEHVEGFQKI